MEPAIIAAIITAVAGLIGVIIGPPLVDWIQRRTSGDSDGESTRQPAPNDVIDEPIDALGEAERQLAEMPLEGVPAPAPLPQGSVMPLSRNPLFVGREDELRALAAHLKANDTTARGQATVAAASGLGGIGKTQLASEFVHRYGQYFSGGVFWLSFSEATDVPHEVAACGGAGGMELRPDFHTLPLEDQVRQVISTWQSELPRLLVFDNCEDEGLLEQWRPPTGGCRVLLTSRRETWNPRLEVRVVTLGVLRREESVALLRRHRSDLLEDDPALEAIAEELGDLPLALGLAGGFLARYRRVISPSEYLAQLRSPELRLHPSLRQAEGANSPIERERDVARTFAVSYDKLDAGDPIDALSLALLARAALFVPGEPIPRELLVKALELPKEDPEALLRAEDAFLRLVALGMLQEQEAGALRMHRLVAAFVQGVVVEKEGPRAIEEAQKAVEEALADTVSPLIDKGYPAPLLELLPHLRVVTDAASGQEDERAALLCSHLGMCLRMIGTFREARPYLERALAIRKEVLGEEHPDTATSLNNLGNLLSNQGKYEEARPYLERALAIRKEVLGEEHLDTAISLNNLGVLLMKQGSYKEARPFYERALAIRERMLGEEHPHTASTLNNLGVLLSDQGKYEEARSLHERALDIREKVLGEEHPDTASSLNNLGDVISDQGRYAEARPFYERGLAIREKMLGEEHPLTALSLNNLGVLLMKQGSYEEAHHYLERALAIRRKVLGEGHRHTQWVRNDLMNLNALRNL